MPRTRTIAHPPRRTTDKEAKQRLKEQLGPHNDQVNVAGLSKEGEFDRRIYRDGGRLTAAERHKMPSDEFALPGGRYPINDASHARNALARASQNATPSERSTIERKVHDKFPGIKQSGD